MSAGGGGEIMHHQSPARSVIFVLESYPVGRFEEKKRETKASRAKPA